MNLISFDFNNPVREILAKMIAKNCKNMDDESKTCKPLQVFLQKFGKTWEDFEGFCKKRRIFANIMQSFSRFKNGPETQLIQFSI